MRLVFDAIGMQVSCDITARFESLVGRQAEVLVRSERGK
jgi:hypothetical protein